MNFVRPPKLNDSITNFVSFVRENRHYTNRFYTQNNKKLAGYIARSVGDYGNTIKLVGRGEKLLWLNVRDALDRTMRDSYQNYRNTDYYD